MKIQNKKAAIELSIGTVVIIVLAMTMLILGIVLVRNIFTGAIDVADITNSQVRSEIIGLFSEQGSNVVIQLGSDKTAKIKEGGDAGNINIGASREGGGTLAKLDDLKFKIELVDMTDDCLDVRTNTQIQEWFQYQFGQPSPFDKLDSNKLFATIKVRVPSGTPTCTQKFTLTVTDTSNPSTPVGIDSFFVEVIQSGIFS